MSYDNIVEYKIIPTKTFKIVRRCAGCGCKQIFTCKDHFRVNANGNCLDIWLIYGCEKCGHTYNLPVYERISPAKLPEQEYAMYLGNDREKVFEIGTNKALFLKNKAEVAWNLVEYEIIPIIEKEIDLEKENVSVKLYNPYDIPVREDKIIIHIFQISRSTAKKLLSKDRIGVSMVRNERNLPCRK